MEIQLVSKDGELSTLCEEIVRDLSQDRPWSFSSTFEASEDSAADLYVLDFEANFSQPDHIPWNYSNVVVLVHRQDVAEVRKVLGFAPSLVLKPATRATLSALLTFAISNQTATALRDDRDQIFERLIEANLKLQEYDQNRTNFLTRVVHDFRAPLTALSGYCGLLLSDSLGPLNDKQKEVIGRMQYSAKRLVRMTSAMLQLSVDRQTQRVPDLQHGDIRTTIDQALHEISPFAENKRVAITLECAPCDGDLYFEQAQIDQVLVNLLENACKFTPRDGSIAIRGYPFFWDRCNGRASTPLPAEPRAGDTGRPNSYRLDVRNSGPALAEEHLESVFEEHTSYSGGRDCWAGGLGLAICKMIISQHQGHVWAENTDQGPMFSFVLPVRRAVSANGAASAIGFKPGDQRHENV